MHTIPQNHRSTSINARSSGATSKPPLWNQWMYGCGTSLAESCACADSYGFNFISSLLSTYKWRFRLLRSIVFGYMSYQYRRDENWKWVIETKLDESDPVRCTSDGSGNQAIRRWAKAKIIYNFKMPQVHVYIFFVTYPNLRFRIAPEATSAHTFSQVECGITAKFQSLYVSITSFILNMCSIPYVRASRFGSALNFSIS